MSDLVEIKPSEVFKINLMYGGVRNMFRRAFYRELGLDKCYVHKDMLPYLEKLEKLLRQENLILEIRDCYRPLEVQALMWEYLPDERYLAPPSRGSKHNKGTALDCTLLDAKGVELTFPTEVDGYREDLIDDFLSGNMAPVLAHLAKASHQYQSASQNLEIKNRQKLKQMMEKAGFVSLEEEWWHYEIKNAADYPLVALKDI